MIRELLALGIRVRAIDPPALDNARAIFGDRVEYVGDAYAAVRGADALLVVTEWPDFRAPSFERLRALMRRPLVLDGRNLFQQDAMRELGFEHHSIGRAPVYGAPAVVESIAS